MIAKSCEALINQMVDLLQARTNPEDVDTKMEDHAADALRYGCMSRPLTPLQKEERSFWRTVRQQDTSVSWMAVLAKGGANGRDDAGLA
jgi:hypothetical protein